MDDTSAGRCFLCHRILSSDIIDTIGDLEALSVCRDCKFLFLQDNNIQPRIHSSLESTGNMLSQQFQNMQPTLSDLENRSRHWLTNLSDTESDAFDSVTGDENVFSYAAFESDSEASVDIGSPPSTREVTFSDTDARSYADSVTDDDEVEGDETTVGSFVGRIQLHRSLATNGRNLPTDWLSEILSDEGIRNSERRRLFGILEDQETSRGDYFDAETHGSHPTAVWFVKNLERVVVNEELVCVICKDNVCVGSVMNRLPCGHVYHPSCILPWLSARNTCPLCRYELPIDGKDCEKVQSGDEYVSSRGNNVNCGGRWWFVAAPLVSVVAIGVVVWLGGQRDDRSRKWWSLL